MSLSGNPRAINTVCGAQYNMSNQKPSLIQLHYSPEKAGSTM
jgi:hypothetical protein